MSNSNKNQSNVIYALLSIAVIIMMLCYTIMLLIPIDLINGCLYRYSIDENGSGSSSDYVVNTAILNANGSGSSLVNISDPATSYGRWINTGMHVSEEQRVKYQISGEVSLCKAYLPENNLQNTSGEKSSGGMIPIPRINDTSTPPVTIYFDAKTDGWRNLTQVFKDDQIVVSLSQEQKSTSTTMQNSIDGSVTQNCQEGSRSYHPICGKFSIWGSDSTYTSSCTWNEKCYKCDCEKKCIKWNWLNECTRTRDTNCSWCGCYETSYGTAPEPYLNSGVYTSPWRDNLLDLATNFNRSCAIDSEISYINGDYQGQKYFWFSADNAAGLLYRFDDDVNPSSSLGGNYNFAKLEQDQSFYDSSHGYNIIMNMIYDDSEKSYLQYRFYDNSDTGGYSNNTGGYVFNIKQTKCRRKNGSARNDDEVGRGAVNYVIMDEDPNDTEITNNSINTMPVDINGIGEIEAYSDGFIWLKIKNKQEDYKDSEGSYDIEFSTFIAKKDFFHTVLNPIFEGFKTKMKAASVTMFKNMTCYKKTNDADNCVNFFQYIRAILIIYISLYGLMFLMGAVQINQYDLVIRVVKVAIVSGLMNDKTFEFFNTYILDVVTSFSDEIMANMSGYSVYTGAEQISNPFMFLNELMTKIFLSTTFYAQILALLSMGLSGPFYFLIVFISIAIAVMVSFRAIAVYLMAFMGITVLISLAPLFLTFILFERTKHLFDSWVKFMVSYMLEPIILLAGIIILTQLFTIYLDYLIGYSVCWKCALPFSLPFPQIENVTPLFLNVPLFCLNWFAPWGIDYRSGVMGINMQHIAALLILSYCMWSYVEFSNMIVGKIAGGAAMSSGTDTSRGMSSVMGGSAMKAMGVQPGSFDSVMNDMKGRANQSVRRAGAVASNRVGSVVKGVGSSASSKASSVAAGSAGLAVKGAGLVARGVAYAVKGIGGSFASKEGTSGIDDNKGQSATQLKDKKDGQSESGQQKGAKAPRNPSSKKGK